MANLLAPLPLQFAINRYARLEKQIISQDYNLELKELLRNNLKAFVRYYWHCMSPNSYIDNWHIDALCEHMTAVAKGEIKRLIVNIPPRCSKTGICTIAFQPWVWSKQPSKKFIYGSQSHKLGMEFARQCRELIQNPSYRDLFKVYIKSDAAGKELFSNTQFGQRLTVSINSAVTSMGADYIIGDDLNDVNSVESEASRADTIRWISNTSVTRVESKDSAFVCLQQRTHPWDATGYLLSTENPHIVHLCLPQEYDETRRCVTTFGNKTWHDPRTKHGELLWPERWDEEYIENVKAQMGEYAYATQHQQFPAPEKGGIFKKDGWHWHKVRGKTELKYIIESWDTALVDTAGSCFSVCTVWGIIEDQYEIRKAILLNLWKGKLEYPELRHLAQRMYHNYRDTTVNYASPISDSPMKANKVIVEEKVNGFCLVQDFNRAGINVEGFNPTPYGKKVVRARIASALIQGGAVLLPCKDSDDATIVPTPYAAKLVSECAMYTGQDGESNDVVDSLSQALIYMNQFGWIYNQHDPYVGKKEKDNVIMHKHLAV